MAKDERFTVIAVTLAILITAGAFVWSHWGALATSVRSKPVADASVSSEEQGSIEVVPNSMNEPEANEILPAVFEIQPEATESFAQASNSPAAVDYQTMAALENLASGWNQSALPAPAEILVRKDRDGRTVVASGTHRRYNDLRQEVQDLDLSDIDTVLHHVEVSGDPADAQALRAALIDTVEAVLEVDLPEVEPDMVAGVHAWQFSDTDYRSMSPAQQHLLLMGRDNAQTVRTKLVEIRQQLGGPDTVEADQPAIEVDPVVIAHSLGSQDPIAELIEP